MLLNEFQHQQQKPGTQFQELAELQAQNGRLEAALAQQREQNAAVAARLKHLEAGAVRAATLVSRSGRGSLSLRLASRAFAHRQI